MLKYNARDILKLSMDELWNLPENRHVLVFDDGEIESHTRSTISSALLWHPLRQIQGPLKTSHAFGTTVRFTGKNQIKILENIIFDIHDTNPMGIDSEYLMMLTAQTINIAYNEYVSRLGGWMATMSLFDVFDVMEHPITQEARKLVGPTSVDINRAYEKFNTLFDETDELAGNPIVDGRRSGIIRKNMPDQAFIAEGYKTDIDSTIFKRPITEGLIRGDASLYSRLIESRGGTKALIFNKELLKKTEYFNRKIQLISQYVANLHMEDCGTTRLINFPMNERRLKRAIGKYYIDEDGVEKVINGKENHLVGKYVRMRSVLGCMHPDPVGICYKCYGTLAFSIPKGTNIGDNSARDAGDKITSSVLSTKHEEASAQADKIKLGAEEARYLYDGGNETLFFKKKYAGKKITLTVNRREVQHMADILFLNELEDYPITYASELTNLRIEVDNGIEGKEISRLRVYVYNRKASFSTEVLKYLKEKKWEYSEQGDQLIFDMSGFDFNKPFLVLPQRHVNMYEVMKRFQTFLHSGVDSEDDKLAAGLNISRKGKRTFLTSYKDPVDALVACLDLINEKLEVDLVHCEILVYAMLARNRYNKDYRLPKPGLDGEFEKYSELMTYRSLSAALAYEKQDKPLVNPIVFTDRNKNPHPYDLLAIGGADQQS